MTVLFPTEASSFDSQVENSGGTVQYKLNAQSLRLFVLHSDVNDVHRAGANRLQNKFPLKTHDSFLDMLQLVGQMGGEWSLRALARFLKCDNGQVWACHVSRSDFESLGTCAACEKWSASHGSCGVKD